MQILQPQFGLQNNQSRQSRLNAKGDKFTLWPSLDFTIGCSLPPRKDPGKDSASRYEDDHYWHGFKRERHLTVETDQAAINRHIDKHHAGPLDDDLRAALFDAKEAEYRYDECDRLVQSAQSAGEALMGLSGVTICHTKLSRRKKRGSKGITSRGKKMVKSAASLLEDRNGRGRLSLICCTLPSVADDGIPSLTNVSADEFEHLVLNWPEIERQFWQKVKRRLEFYGLPTDYVAVTEVQENRFFGKRREIALHIHGLLCGRHPGKDWSISVAEFRAIWESIISNFIGRPISLPAGTQIDGLRKSCKAELGKYLSKGCKITQAIIDAGKGHMLPKSWYRLSKSLRAEVKAKMVVHTDGFAEWVEKYRWLLRENKILYYCEKKIKLQYTTDFGETWKERQKLVGIAGRFTSKAAFRQARKWFKSGVNLDLILTRCNTYLSTA